MKKYKKLLLVRLDRMGDLVLTLPVDSHPDLKDTECFWIIPVGLDFIVQNRPFRTITKKLSFFDFFRFVKWLRQENFSASVVFHAPWWMSLALFLARIPWRVGPLSQWHSFLFFNKGIRQKRSECQYHELDYNYLLLEQGLDLQKLPQHLPLELHAEPPENLSPRSYVVVHPGMGGSARNWPLAYYKNLIESLSESTSVFVTGTNMDREWLEPLKKNTKVNENIKWLDGQLSGTDLLRLLKGAKTVVAPSTGVLHLAAALGVHTIGIFSPITVQKPDRWGPKGPRALTIAPAVDCPGYFKCIGEKCPHYDCMEKIDIGPEMIL
ncbi:MAG: glycosyltransferase family 9 protein [Pseudobdellovibrionaceae bacterium]|nr:glycosyltransferase family 9 protein [Bdellovibrionales bacterium]USN46343.1 MAG: glycosyltransferase family 9 protein [Pseudobdellovibrionaceae bacterium]